MGRSLACLATVMFVFASPVALCAQEVIELREGKWQTVSTQPAQAHAGSTTRSVFTSADLDQIEVLIDKRQYHAAIKRQIKWFASHKGSPIFDRGLMLMARALYGYGDRLKAFYYCDELMDEYPASPLFYNALTLQYQVADAYLNGYKRRILHIPMLGAQDEAIEMLYRIQQRSPGSELAEKSLLRTADYFYDDKQYDLAAEVYGAYIKSYPRSPIIPRAKLRQAFSNLAQFRGVRFDPTPAIDARTQLSDVQAQYPELAQRERVPMYIDRIDKALARKLYVTADFYQRTHEPEAAAYLFESFLKIYPDAPEAEAARKRLASLPKPKISPIGPATLPVSTAAE